MRAAFFIITAAAAYFLGCANGAILVSRAVFHEDVRGKGSGNAGLTNFYRNYGAKSVGIMIAIDVLKAATAILLGRLVFGKWLDMPVLGQYWAGLFVVLGHSFPCMYQFRGGKGILCSGVLLILLDWRIAAVGFGLFLAAVLLTRYVSLGSLLAAASFPFTTYFVYRTETNFLWIFVLSLVTAVLVIWSHRKNVVRLLTGKENKFRFHSEKEKKS